MTSNITEIKEFYKGKRVLITGHSGFKGSWLTLWLKSMGADVRGYSFGMPSDPSHYMILAEEDWLPMGRWGNNLLNYPTLSDTINEFQPEIIFHLAADAIVARTFEHPRDTFNVNVMGAVNLLESCRNCESIKSIVMVTTDKVYSNNEWVWGYRENDKLGDLTPYGASKVCVEQVINCYRKQYISHIATARAGNVIGGGDWAYKRLIPDIIRATVEGKPVEVHTPNATRPWQFVLEPLYGYMLLGKALYEEPDKYNEAWNFGPTGEMKVEEVLQMAQMIWPKIQYAIKEEETHPSMVELLKIDSSKSWKELGWKTQYTMAFAIGESIEWYKKYYEDGDVISLQQIKKYERWL